MINETLRLLVAVATINPAATLPRQGGTPLTGNSSMSDAAISLASQYGWSLAGLFGLVAIAALFLRLAQLRRHSRRLLAALNNMPQGLCMWSPTGRLILCNERYGQMYHLSTDLTTPGVSLRDLLDHRIKVGTLSATATSISPTC